MRSAVVSVAGVALALCGPRCGLVAEAAAQAVNRTVFVGHYYFNSQTGEGGTVASLRVNADGTLTLVGNAPSGAWTQSIALSPSGRWLAAAAGTSNTISEELRVFEVAADGQLTQVHLTTVPDSPLAMVWLTDDLLAVTATKTNGSSVGVFQWTPPEAPAAPSLTERDRKPSGVFNSYLAYHPGQPYLYTQNTTGGSAVQRWRIDFSAGNYGRLTDTGSVPQVAYPLSPMISRDGARLYAGGGISAGRHAVLGLRLGDEDLLPTPLDGSPYFSSGNSPAYLAGNGDDRYVLIGHGTDATVRSFAVAEDGSLEDTGNVFLVQDLQGAIGEIASLRDLVFVTDDTGALDQVQGIYSLRLGADGTMTPIGAIVSTGTPRPEGGIAVWDPTSVCAADYTGDSQVNPADVSAVVIDWFQGLTDGSLYADVDGDRALTPSDLGAFVAIWLDAVVNGC